MKFFKPRLLDKSEKTNTCTEFKQKEPDKIDTYNQETKKLNRANMGKGKKQVNDYSAQSKWKWKEREKMRKICIERQRE